MFAQRLKELRKDARKTQNDVAEYLEIRRSTYGEYERGKITPPYDKIKALSDYFGVTVEYLMEDKKQTVDVCKVLNGIVNELVNEHSKPTIGGHTLKGKSKDLTIEAINNTIKLIELMLQRERK